MRVAELDPGSWQLGLRGPDEGKARVESDSRVPAQLLQLKSGVVSSRSFLSFASDCHPLLFWLG